MVSVLENLVHDLIESHPRSRAAIKAKAEIEHRLMKTLWKDGLRGVERAVARLNAGGYAFGRGPETGNPRAGYREWRCSLDNDRRLLEISAFNTRGLQFASVQYRAVARLRLNKRQRELSALHEGFYSRYNDIARRAYASKREPRLRPVDRLILLIAEMEADVNNGGFRQYLSNKGKRRARSALAALQTVGAKKNHAWLDSALSSNVTDSTLEKLDDQFYRSPEDLAALVMNHIAASEKGIGRRDPAPRRDANDAAVAHRRRRGFIRRGRRFGRHS